MRRTRPILTAFLTAVPAAAALAGPLAPPAGPVAPSMKTLQQVEPRTPISAATTPGDADSVYRISQSGSYYLTADVIGVAGKSGIQIDADDVTIDLGGFAVRGVPGALSGIIDRDDESLPSVRSAAIHGGLVEAWPRDGVDLFLTQGGRLMDLTVRGCSGGVRATAGFVVRSVHATANTNIGIEVGNGSVVTECSAANNGTGFDASGATIENCTARYNTLRGFSVTASTVRGCTAEANAETGISATRSRIEECLTYAGDIGIRAGHAATVEGCTVHGADACGILVENHNCRIVGNRITSSGAALAPNAAIHVNQIIQNAEIADNSGVDNARGVSVSGTNCLILRNSFGRPAQNYPNFVVLAGNRVAPITYAAASTGTIASGAASQPGSFTSNDPNANISY